jgi:hypothetical protein
MSPLTLLLHKPIQRLVEFGGAFYVVGFGRLE